MAPFLTNSPLASRAWRLQNLYTIRDANGKLVPYTPNLGQRAFYNSRWFCNAILKARKLGFSTHIEMENLDAMLMVEGCKCGIIDYTLDDAKKKLAMIKLAHRYLDDPEIHPETWRIGRAIKKAIPIVKDTKQEIVLGNGSSCTASTSHRGDTLNRLHISELGKTSIWAPGKAKEIVEGAFNALTPGNVIDSESTHEGGKLGTHYNLVNTTMRIAPEQLTKVDFKFHFFPWWRDPRYVLADNLPIRPEILIYFQRITLELLAQAHESWAAGFTGFTHAQMLWYDRKQLNQKHGMKKEFPSTPGEAFEAMSEHAIYGKWMADLRVAGRIVDFLPERQYPIFTCSDIGLSDFFSCWLIQPVGRSILVLDWMEFEGEPGSEIPGHWLRWESKYNKPIAGHFLPHDAETRDRGNGKTYRQTLIESGAAEHLIHVVPRTPDVWLGIGYVRDVLPHCWFHKTHCDTARVHNGEEFPSGVACLEGYQKDVSATGTTLREMPKHDLFSHSADAFRTFAEAWRRGMVQSAGMPTSPPRAVGRKPKARR